MPRLDPLPGHVANPPPLDPDDAPKHAPDASANWPRAEHDAILPTWATTVEYPEGPCAWIEAARVDCDWTSAAVVCTSVLCVCMSACAKLLVAARAVLCTTARAALKLVARLLSVTVALSTSTDKLVAMLPSTATARVASTPTDPARLLSTEVARFRSVARLDAKLLCTEPVDCARVSIRAAVALIIEKVRSI